MSATDNNARPFNRLRPVSFETDVSIHAEGSCMAAMGNTRVLCTATVEDKVPSFLEGREQGWITAEYGMLPRSTNTRMGREASRGKQSGRTMEIQRLIGRSLRAAVDLEKLGERTITLDCDVIQADGGTRTASISGAFVALYQAIQHMIDKGELETDPVTHYVASVSVGIYKGMPVLDLDYAEDSTAETDMNIVMNEAQGFIEIQGTAEGTPFSNQEMDQMLDLARKGIGEIMQAQKACLEQS